MSDRVITEELRRPTDFLASRDWSGNWWVREYDLPFHVILRQWSGTRWINSTTGDYYRISIIRYWALWWRVWWHRRRGAELPKARLLP